MRVLALFVSGAVFAVAATQTQNLPELLVRDYKNLAAAPSVTVDYTVQIVGEAPEDYKLVLSKPNVFKLTTPTGFTVSDGKTVTTYKTATKTYTEEAFTPAWVSSFAKKPEAVAWAAYLQKEPQEEVTGAKVGESRVIKDIPVTEVQVSFKKSTDDTTLYIDKKLGIARGALLKTGGKEYLVTAQKLEIGKEPLPAETFAFVAPEGATKEVVLTADFASVQALMNDKCMPCHNSTNHRDSIDLTSYDGISKIVTAGDAENSLLIKAVRGHGVKLMPIGRPPLSEDQIKTLETWINAGAKQ